MPWLNSRTPKQLKQLNLEPGVCVMFCLGSQISQERENLGHNSAGGSANWLTAGFWREIQRMSSVRADHQGRCECRLLKRQGWVHTSSSLQTHALLPLFPASLHPRSYFHLTLEYQFSFVRAEISLQDFSGLRLRAFLPIVQPSKCMCGKKKRRRISDSIN